MLRLLRSNVWGHHHKIEGGAEVPCKEGIWNHLYLRESRRGTTLPRGEGHQNLYRAKRLFPFIPRTRDQLIREGPRRKRRKLRKSQWFLKHLLKIMSITF
jgi:hypothetical protein